MSKQFRPWKIDEIQRLPPSAQDHARVGHPCRLIRRLSFAALLTCIALAPIPAKADSAELSYPLVIHTRYEPVDPKTGGNFVIWIDQVRVWHGLDSHLYPAVKYVDITHMTPSPGSPPITIIEVMSINSSVPEFYHIAGLVRVQISGMILKTTSIPR